MDHGATDGAGGRPVSDTPKRNIHTGDRIVLSRVAFIVHDVAKSEAAARKASAKLQSKTGQAAGWTSYGGLFLVLLPAPDRLDIPPVF